MRAELCKAVCQAVPAPPLWGRMVVSPGLGYMDTSLTVETHRASLVRGERSVIYGTVWTNRSTVFSLY